MQHVMRSPLSAHRSARKLNKPGNPKDLGLFLPGAFLMPMSAQFLASFVLIDFSFPTFL